MASVHPGVLQYEPWECACSAANAAFSYICDSCKAVNEEVKLAIISRPPYVYKHLNAVVEVKDVPNYCGLCGQSTENKVCEECREGVGEPVDESIPKPAVPEDALRPWKCENCEAENFSDSNCRSCSMIRKPPSSYSIR